MFKKLPCTKSNMKFISEMLKKMSPASCICQGSFDLLPVNSPED